MCQALYKCCTHTISFNPHNNLRRSIVIVPKVQIVRLRFREMESFPKISS